MFETLVVVSLIVGQAEKPAAPAALGQQIANSLADAFETKAETIRKLGVVVSTDDRGAGKLDKDQQIDNLRELLLELAAKHEREIVDRQTFDDACRKADVGSVPKPSDLQRLRRQIELDAVLSATWSHRGDRQTIRLAIISPDRVVWTKTLSGKVEDEIPAVRKPANEGNARAPRVPDNGKALPPVGPLDGERIPGIVGSGGLIPNGNAVGGVVPSNAGGDAKPRGPSEPADAAKANAAGEPAKAAGGKKSAAAAGNSNKGSATSTSSTTNSKSNAGASSTAANSTKVATPNTPSTNSTPKSEAGSRPTTTVPELNRKVLEFASNNLGRPVGNGECWTLAAEALLHANAQPPRGYTFGRELAAGEAPVPGDIMQFTSARFQSRNFTAIMGLPNHTAIVYAVDGDKTTFIHQNFGSRMVTLLTLDMTSRTSGTYTTYRPVARE
jgi:hypothetical protein